MQKTCLHQIGHDDTIVVNTTDTFTQLVMSQALRQTCTPRPNQHEITANKNMVPFVRHELVSKWNMRSNLASLIWEATVLFHINSYKIHHHECAQRRHRDHIKNATAMIKWLGGQNKTPRVEVALGIIKPSFLLTPRTWNCWHACSHGIYLGSNTRSL